MLNGKKLVVVIPAYNAANTLRQTYSEVPVEFVDEVLLVDDHSTASAKSLARPDISRKLRQSTSGAASAMGSALTEEKRFDEALGHFEEALRLQPDAAKVHSNMGAALGSMNRLDEAVVQLNEALRLDPDLSEHASESRHYPAAAGKE